MKVTPLQQRHPIPPVLDACCGGRAFWFDKEDRRAFFVDIRSGVFKINRKERNRNPIVVDPDWQGSFTNLPFRDEISDHVVFDPPHMLEGPTGNMMKTYGVLTGCWREVLRKGFAECFRVLRPGGTLIFKWCDYDIPVKEILKLTPEKPLYGHRSGKQSKTHWIAFLKHYVQEGRIRP